ncbi:MAG: hypothetical protein OEZ04_11410, partial [Nitrospinota bacterium]|nr:hypothetical protein [Nitrospinota bacterium]
KTGIIEYDVKGPKEDPGQVRGKMTVYFKNHGATRAMKLDGQMKGDDGKWYDMNGVSIVTPETVVSVSTEYDDAGKKSVKGRKWTNPVKHYVAAFASLSDDDKKQYRSIAAKDSTVMDFNGMLFNFGGGKKLKIAGYSCDAAEIMFMEVCQMEGSPIPLKGAYMIFNATARKVSANARVSDANFQPPKGVKIEVDQEHEKSSRQWAEMNVKDVVKISSAGKILNSLFGGGKSPEKSGGKAAPAKKAEAPKGEAEKPQAQEEQTEIQKKEKEVWPEEDRQKARDAAKKVYKNVLDVFK